jgi:hypothetical protein
MVRLVEVSELLGVSHQPGKIVAEPALGPTSNE